MLASLALAGSASAHAELDSSAPGDGASLAQAPRQLVLRLSESVELSASTISISDGDGHTMPTGALRLTRAPGAGTEAPVTLVVDLPTLGRGDYRVDWRTLSSDDLHVTQGVLVFGVGTTTDGASAVRSAAAQPRPSTVEAATRWVGLLALGVALGCVTLLVLLSRVQHVAGVGRPVRRRLLGVASPAAWTALVAGLVLPVTQAAGAGGDVGATLRRLLLTGAYAPRWWLHQAALACLVLAVRAARHRADDADAAEHSRRLGVVAGACAVVACTTATLMGHGGARAASRPLLVVVESSHVLAALLWTGSVVAAAVVLTAPRRPGAAGLRSAVLRRFGAVAAGCVAVMVVTGLLLAGRRIATLDALVHSTYGVTLLVKCAVGLLAGLLGLVSSVALRPPWAARVGLYRAPQRWAGRLLPWEGLLVVGALGAAAVLAASAPASGPRWAVAHPPALLVGGNAGDLVETVRVKPDRPGANFVSVDVFDSRRPAPGPVRSVEVTLRGPTGSTQSAPAVTAGGSTWLVAGSQLTAGVWHIGVRASRSGLPDATASYRWVVPDPAARQVTGVAAAPLTRWTDPAAAVVGLAALAGLAGALHRRRRPRVEAGTADVEDGGDRAEDGAAGAHAAAVSAPPALEGAGVR